MNDLNKYGCFLPTTDLSNELFSKALSSVIEELINRLGIKGSFDISSYNNNGEIGTSFILDLDDIADTDIEREEKMKNFLDWYNKQAIAI